MSVFGKEIERKFVVYENNEPIEAYSIVSAALYSSLDNAIAQTNAIASMSSYTALAESPYTISYNLPTISDPNPSSDRKTWEFWEAITYKLSASGDAQTDYRTIEVARAEVGESVLTATKEDLKQLFPALSAYLSDARIDDILELAKLRIKLDLNAQGIKFARARGLEETQLALAYLAISMVAESQFVQNRQEAFYIRSKDYAEMYNSLLTKIKLAYDSDGDGKTDETREAAPNFRYYPR